MPQKEQQRRKRFERDEPVSHRPHVERRERREPDPRVVALSAPNFGAFTITRHPERQTPAFPPDTVVRPSHDQRWHGEENQEHPRHYR